MRERARAEKGSTGLGTSMYREQKDHPHQSPKPRQHLMKQGKGTETLGGGFRGG